MSDSSWADPLLPSNQTRLEAALCKTMALGVDPEVVRRLWDPQRCPAALLPWLAWTLSVDEWDDTWREEVKRQVISDSLEYHRRKGTPWAVRHVFRSLGLGDIDIEEGRGGYRRDGSIRRSAFYVRGDRSVRWAEYRIICHHLLTIKQAATAERMLAHAAPVRSSLYEINFSGATLIRNGIARRDGSYTRGIVSF